MTDDAKEWVTVKVPKQYRDEARAVDATYGEVLQAGVEALTGDTTDLYEVGNPEPVDTAHGDPELHDDLERLKNAVETVEERTGKIESQLEQMGAGR